MQAVMLSEGPGGVVCASWLTPKKVERKVVKWAGRCILPK